MKRGLATAAAALLLIPAASLPQEGSNYSVDPQQSKVEIHVGKEGTFKAFGHDHLISARQVSGRAQFDPKKINQSSVTLRIPTKSITVVDPGESEKDRQDVQATMEGEKVLDV